MKSQNSRYEILDPGVDLENAQQIRDSTEAESHSNDEPCLSPNSNTCNEIPEVQEEHGLWYKLFHLNAQQLADLTFLHDSKKEFAPEPINLPLQSRLKAYLQHIYLSQNCRDVVKSVLAYLLALLFCFHNSWTLPLFGDAPVHYVTLFATCFIIAPPGNAPVGVMITKTIIIVLTMAATTAIVFLLVYWLNDHGVYLICVIAITAWLLGMYRYLFPDQVSEAAGIGFTFSTWMFLDAAQNTNSGWHPELLLSLWSIYSCGLLICVFINLLIFPKLTIPSIERDFHLACNELFNGLDLVTHTFMYVGTAPDESLENSSSVDAVEFQLQTASEKLTRITESLDALRTEFNITYFDDHINDSILFSIKRLQRHVASMSSSLRLIAKLPSCKRQHLNQIIQNVKPALCLLVEALKEELHLICNLLDETSSTKCHWWKSLYKMLCRKCSKKILKSKTTKTEQVSCPSEVQPVKHLQVKQLDMIEKTNNVVSTESSFLVSKKEPEVDIESSCALSQSNPASQRPAPLADKRRSTFHILQKNVSGFSEWAHLGSTQEPAQAQPSSFFIPREGKTALGTGMKAKPPVPNGFHGMSYLDLHTMLAKNSHIIPNAAALARLPPTSNKYRLILGGALQNFDHTYKQAVIQIMKNYVAPKWRASESFVSNNNSTPAGSRGNSSHNSLACSPTLTFMSTKKALHKELVSKFSTRHTPNHTSQSSASLPNSSRDLPLAKNLTTNTISYQSKPPNFGLPVPMLETIDSSPRLTIGSSRNVEPGVDGMNFTLDSSNSEASIGSAADYRTDTAHQDDEVQIDRKNEKPQMYKICDALEAYKITEKYTGSSQSFEQQSPFPSLTGKDSSGSNSFAHSFRFNSNNDELNLDVTGFESLMMLFYFFFGIREFTKEASILCQRVEHRKTSLHIVAPWFFKFMRILSKAFCLSHVHSYIKRHFRKSKPLLSTVNRSETQDSIASSSTFAWCLGYTDLLMKDLAEENELFRSFKKLRASLDAKMFQRPREGGQHHLAKSRFRFIIYQLLKFCKGPQFVYANKLALSMSLFSLLLVSPRTQNWAFHYHLEWALASIAITTTPMIGNGPVNHLWRIGGSIFGGLWAVVTWFICETSFVPAAVFCTSLSAVLFYVHLTSNAYRMFAIITLSSFTSIYFAAVRNYSGSESSINIMETLLAKTATICLAVVYGMIFTWVFWPTYARAECRIELSHLFQDLCLLLRKNQKLLICQTSTSLKSSTEFEEFGSNGKPKGQFPPIKSALSSITVYSAVPDVLRERLENSNEWQIDISANGSPSIDEFLVLEFQIQHYICKIRKLLNQAAQEPRILGPFPKDMYMKLCDSCQIILDRLLTFRMAANKETSIAFKTYIFPVVRDHADQLIKIILENIYLLSGALQLKKPLPPPRDIGKQATECLLDALFTIPSNLERTILNGDMHYVFVYFGLRDIMEEVTIMRQTFVEIYGQMRMVS